MQLLVSVASATEASAALAGGADIIDAKDPLAGALGPVHVDVLRAIAAAVGGARPVTAALGDAAGEAAIERAARAFTAAGAELVKVGFAGVSSERIAALVSAAVRGAQTGGRGHAGVIAVAYADADHTASLAALPELAARGVEGVLLDTADKSGPGLRGLVAQDALAAWVARAHAAGLLVALAGKLTAWDLPYVRDAGADIAGVRGAACDGGRAGGVSVDRVRLLRALCGPTPGRHHRAAPGVARPPGPQRQSPA
jgi:(5-formylfuran-3-yl)methyl phosphate synthase